MPIPTSPMALLIMANANPATVSHVRAGVAEAARLAPLNEAWT